VSCRTACFNKGEKVEGRFGDDYLAVEKAAGVYGTVYSAVSGIVYSGVRGVLLFLYGSTVYDCWGRGRVCTG